MDPSKERHVAERIKEMLREEGLDPRKVKIDLGWLENDRPAGWISVWVVEKEEEI